MTEEILATVASVSMALAGGGYAVYHKAKNPRPRRSTLIAPFPAISSGDKRKEFFALLDAVQEELGYKRNLCALVVADSFGYKTDISGETVDVWLDPPKRFSSGGTCYPIHESDEIGDVPIGLTTVWM